MERIPFQATHAAAAYGLTKLPLRVVLENVRSLYNVGAFFRTCDAAGVEALDLCGITGRPPHKEIHKTALGAEETVRWRHYSGSIELAHEMRDSGYELAAVETSLHAVDLFDWRPSFPVGVVFGNEVEGGHRGLSGRCDTDMRMPMRW